MINFQDLWTECEALYPANKDICIKLQDEHGINVNLLLLALYLDNHTEIRYSQTQWQKLIVSIETWEQTIVKPYRQLRRLAKTMVEPTEYQQMLDVELMMERKSQHLISNQLTEMVADSQDSNLKNYLRLFGDNLHIDIRFNV